MEKNGDFPKICLFHNSQSMFKIIPMLKIRENKDVIETTTLGIEGEFIEQLWILSLEQCPKRMNIAETSAFDQGIRGG